MNQLSLYAEEKHDNQSVKFQVDGKILNELSKQVTNHIFALGELIKNSYDAQATYIKITLDLKSSVLIIDDNGIGITQENMQSILHIAKSSKKYSEKFTFDINGEKIERFTQGSKGLGLFSAFKFGDIVNWDTKSDDSDSFSLTVDKEQVTKLSNISNAIYKLKKGERKLRGTTITINLNNNDNELLFTYNHLKDLINTKRLVNFFHDNSITIDFNLIKKDGKNEENFPINTIKNKDLEADILNRNLFKITFSSQENNIKFFYKNRINSFHNYNYQLKSNFYTIKFTIYAFTLKAGEKKKIDSLFLNSRNDLTPIIYINDALFNNDNIFDPSITRKIKSSKTLPQLVGFIDITCTHPDLQFNNERTDLVFNSFNEVLKEDIKNINIFIQEKGKYLERNLPSFINTDTSAEPEDTSAEPEDTSAEPEDTSAEPEDTSAEPEDTSAEPEDTSAEPEDTSAELEDTSAEPKDTSAKPVEINDIEPYINLKASQITKDFETFPKTIDLKNFFEDARDSKNNPIFIENIGITVDNNPILFPFIEQIDYASTIKICYFFIDSFAKNSNGKLVKCCEYLELNIRQKNNEFTTATVNSKPLISPIGPEYTFYLNDVNKLIDQINNLGREKKSYDMCIAAALRLVFDLTLYNYEKLSRIPPQSKDLGVKVETLIHEIKENRPHFTRVSRLIDPRFSLVDNIFESPNQFAQKATISNLGSHTGSHHLTTEEIKDLAQYAGYFAQLVDAHCKIKFGNS